MTQLRVAARPQDHAGEDLLEKGPDPLLHFASGLPGFPSSHEFVVSPLGPELEPFCKLRSLDTPGLEFIVVPPGAIFNDYVIEIDSDTAERIDLTAQNVVVLVIVALAGVGATPTVNLLGPIVTNRDTRQSIQVVQHRSGYGVAVPVSATSARP